MYSAKECFSYPCIVNSAMHVQLDELVSFIYSSKIQNQNRKNTKVPVRPVGTKCNEFDE